MENYSGKDFCALEFNYFRGQEEFLETNCIVIQLSQVIYFFCFLLFPFKFVSVCGNCSQSSLPCRAGIDRRSWRKTNFQIVNAPSAHVRGRGMELDHL